MNLQLIAGLLKCVLDKWRLIGGFERCGREELLVVTVSSCSWMDLIGKKNNLLIFH